MKARLIGLSCASMALAADQITKAAVLGNMDALPLGVEVLPAPARYIHADVFFMPEATAG